MPKLKLLSFTFGLLVGAVVATAAAHFPQFPGAGSLGGAAATIEPLSMMTRAGPLPTETHDMF